MPKRDLIAANDAFYKAFAAHDATAMEALWASDGPIACIHPGWGALNERRRIIESWRAIFDSPDAPHIVCVAPQAFLFGDWGFVVCFEQIGATCLIATNIFARRDDAWKMVHHQAGPTPMRPEAAASNGERLH